MKILLGSGEVTKGQSLGLVSALASTVVIDNIYRTRIQELPTI